MIEVRNVGFEVNGRYEMRVLDAWVPTTRVEIAGHERKGQAIHWNPRNVS
jgi:hypothetical protein